MSPASRLAAKLGEGGKAIAKVVEATLAGGS